MKEKIEYGVDHFDNLPIRASLYIFFLFLDILHLKYQKTIYPEQLI